MSQIFNVPKADTYPFTIDVAKATLVNYPSGLAAFSKLWFYGKLSTDDSDAAAIFKKDLTSGVSVLTAGSPTVDGLVQVVLAPADTSALYNWPISVYGSLKGYDGTNEYTIAGGPANPIILLVSATPTSNVS